MTWSRSKVMAAPRRRNVVVKHAPYTVVPDLEKIGCGLHRHLSGHGDHEGIEQLAEAAAAARPRNWDLSGLAALRASNAGNGGVDKRLMLEEAKMLPVPRPCVVDRLIGRAAGRASELGTRLEADLEVDLLGLGIKAHVGDAPGRLQARFAVNWYIRSRHVQKLSFSALRNSVMPAIALWKL
jgi:hypothetical protein